MECQLASRGKRVGGYRCRGQGPSRGWELAGRGQGAEASRQTQEANIGRLAGKGQWAAARGQWADGNGQKSAGRWQTEANRQSPWGIGQRPAVSSKRPAGKGRREESTGR